MKKNPRAGVLKVIHQMSNGAYLCRVKLDRIHADGCQRNLNQARVSKIAANFKPELVNPPMLALDGGVLRVFDGQHTVAALIKSGQTSWEALVRTDLSPEQRSSLFIKTNTSRVSVSGWDRFYAGVLANEAGDQPPYGLIQGILEHNNLKHPKQVGGNRKSADITSPTDIIKAFNKGGLALVGRVCQVLNKSLRTKAGTVQQQAKDAEFVRGLIAFINGNPQLSDSDMHKVFTKAPAASIYKAASAENPGVRITATHLRRTMECLSQGILA